MGFSLRTAIVVDWLGAQATCWKAARQSRKGHCGPSAWCHARSRQIAEGPRSGRDLAVLDVDHRQQVLADFRRLTETEFPMCHSNQRPLNEQVACGANRDGYREGTDRKDGT